MSLLPIIYYDYHSIIMSLLDILQIENMLQLIRNWKNIVLM